VRGGLAEANAADTADIAKTAGTARRRRRRAQGTGSQAAAKLVGEKIAERAKPGDREVVFDRAATSTTAR